MKGSLILPLFCYFQKRFCVLIVFVLIIITVCVSHVHVQILQLALGRQSRGCGISASWKVAAGTSRSLKGKILRLITNFESPVGFWRLHPVLCFFVSRARLSRLLRLNNDLTVFSRVVSHELSILSYCCQKRLAGAVIFIISNASYRDSFLLISRKK